MNEQRISARLLALLCLAASVFAVAPASGADFKAGVAAARAGDYTVAMREWRPLADGGNAEAQFNLGLLHENGLGVPIDKAEAARWFRRAAEQEDRLAQAYLAEMYGKGLGVPRDDAEALRWFRRAAEHGHAPSQHNVGLFYATGRGVEPNEVEAYAWLTVAQENGGGPADLLDLLTKNMSEGNLDKARVLAAEIRRRCRLD